MSWRPRQYVFHGAEVLYDPDEDEDDEDGNEDEEDSSGSDSDSSISSNELRENGTDVTVPNADSRITTIPLSEGGQTLPEETQQPVVQQELELGSPDKSNI